MDKKARNKSSSNRKSESPDISLDAADAIFASFRRAPANSCLRFNARPDPDMSQDQPELLDGHERTIAYVHSRLPDIYAKVAAQTRARELEETEEATRRANTISVPSPR